MTPLLAAIAALLATINGHTSSLKEAREQEAIEAALARQVSYTNEVCGLQLQSDIDWPSASGWGGDDLVGACDRALGAVETQCRAGSKRTVAQLTRFICAGDGAGPAFNGGVFRFGAARGADGFAQTRALLDRAQ